MRISTQRHKDTEFLITDLPASVEQTVRLLQSEPLMQKEPEPARLIDLSCRIIAAAIEIHSTIGPGLLESVYRACMLHELRRAGMKVDAEQLVPICYKDLVLEGSYRIDLLVNDDIILELKAVEQLLPVHHAQLLSYLRLTDKPLGLLINFNVPRLVQGVRRVVNAPGFAGSTSH
jgi:GxxExxY protein